MRVSAAEARRRLPELLRAASRGDVIFVDRRGKPLGALVAATVAEAHRRTTAKLFKMPDIERAVVAAASQVSGIDRVVLFGSYARGDARAKSDIDLLLVIAPFKDDESYWRVYEEFEKRLTTYRAPYEILPVNRGQWEHPEGIVASAHKEGITLYERSPSG